VQQKDNKKPLENEGQKVEEDVQNAVSQAQQEVARSRVPWYRAFQRTRVLIGFNVLLFGLFALLAFFVHVYPVIPVDVNITREFQENQNPWLRMLMFIVSWPGSQPFFMPALVLLTVLAFWSVRLRLEAALILVLSIVSEVLNGLLKLLVSRPRPTASLVEVLQAAGGKSFPSGHVMAYVAYWGLLFSLVLILFKMNRWWHYVLLIIPAFFVILVGPSRIYLGDHWASDVLGAYMIGGILLSLSLRIYLALKQRGVLASPARTPEEQAAEPQPQQEHSRA